jgi:CRP-like cAMP-binding protein
MDSAQIRQASGPCPLHIRGENRLLELLPSDDRERVRSTMERRSFKIKTPIFEADKPIPHVHFVLHGVASLIIYMEDGAMVEVGTVGNEGLVGLPLLHGAEQSHTHAIYQSDAEALIMSGADFKAEIALNGAFARIMHRYAQGFLSQASQSTACNRLHHVEQRLCRWILMTHDRTGEDRLQLTQEFLAAMLGVRRASVNLVAGVLQKAGLIEYKRGTIVVLDREGLEGGACECYGIVRQEYERLLC